MTGSLYEILLKPNESGRWHDTYTHDNDSRVKRDLLWYNMDVSEVHMQQSQQSIPKAGDLYVLPNHVSVRHVHDTRELVQIEKGTCTLISRIERRKDGHYGHVTFVANGQCFRGFFNLYFVALACQ